MKKRIILSTLLLSTSVFAASYNVIISGNYKIHTQGGETPDPSPAITVLERKSTASGGYTIWSDGYKEAWGQYNKGSALKNTDVINVSLPFSFNKPAVAYAKGNILARESSGIGTFSVLDVQANAISFGGDASDTGTLKTTSFTWYASGY